MLTLTAKHSGGLADVSWLSRGLSGLELLVAGPRGDFIEDEFDKWGTGGAPFLALSQLIFMFLHKLLNLMRGHGV